MSSASNNTGILFEKSLWVKTFNSLLRIVSCQNSEPALCQSVGGICMDWCRLFKVPQIDEWTLGRRELLNIFFSKGLLVFVTLKMKILRYIWQFLREVHWILNRLASVSAAKNFVTLLLSSLRVNRWVRPQNVLQKAI